ncbi:MAG: TonB-dependent receptor [Bacteroidota bacterium]
MNHPLYKHALLLFACMVFALSSFAQTISDVKVTASFQQKSARVILQQLDRQLPIQFFYKEAELPTRALTLSFQETPIEEVMKALFDGTLLNYMTYRNYAIIIAPDRILQEVYSSDYYQGLEKSLTDSDEKPKVKPIVVGSIDQLSPNGKTKVKGIVRDEQTREPIIGATLMWTSLDQGTVTDVDGSFESELPVGEHELVIRYIGYEDQVQVVQVYSDGEIKIKLQKEAVQLGEVTVSARRQDANVDNAQVGLTTLDVKNIKKLPAFLGEADVVKSLLLQPGVSSIGEGAVGFNVRGGEVDQNLIMQDEGFLLNSSHALGFFSTFNADLVSTVDLYKGNIPAKYGGRLASVMDVRMKDGDFDQFRLKAGIGPVTSKVSLEGPIIKEKASFIAGFRSSYSDWILSRINVLEVQRSSAFFYDANARMTFRLNDKNTIVASGYASSDEFTYNEEFGFEYSTIMGQIGYRKIFSDNILSNLSLVASDYKSAQFDLQGVDAARLNNDVSYLKAKEQLTFTPSNDFQLDAGLSAIYYRVNPGLRTPFGEQSAITVKELEQEQGLESAVFASAEWTVNPRLLVSGGLRFALYQFLGPKTVFDYENEERPELSETLGSNLIDGAIKTYSSFEPRISLRYKLNPTSSIKGGYSRTAQFINQIFNSDSPTPTSQWQLSTQYVEPTRSHNFSIGYFRNFNDNMWEASVETYGRIIDALFDYKDFAVLAANEQLETELLAGIGRSYGLEFSIKKNKGPINGFISYALTRAERQVEGINRGAWYRSNFDKPHDLSILFNYQPNRRNTLTINFIYGTGRPTTPPVGNTRLENGLVVPIYSLRNQLRIPDYHRLDLAYTIGQGYKKDQRFRTSWTLSIYNVYARRNAFSVYYTQGAFQRVQANRLAILGTAFPSVTFNLEVL